MTRWAHTGSTLETMSSGTQYPRPSMSAVARAAVRCLDAWLDSRTPALLRLIRGDDPYLADYGLLALRRREAPPFQSPAREPEWSEVSAALAHASPPSSTSATQWGKMECSPLRTSRKGTAGG